MYKQHPITKHYVSDRGFIIKTRGLGEKKLRTTKTGYKCIGFGGTSYYVHRMVIEAFIGAIPENLQVNHINGIKDDNRLVNLEVCTASENMRHAVSTGLKPGYPGELNSVSKLTNKEYYSIIELIMAGKSNTEIAFKYRLHSRYVSLIRGKKRLKTIWNLYESVNGVKPVPKSGDNSFADLELRLKILEELNIYTNKELADKYSKDASIFSRVRSRLAWQNIWDVYDSRNVQRSVERRRLEA